jgi:hypothetical protein
VISKSALTLPAPTTRQTTGTDLTQRICPRSFIELSQGGFRPAGAFFLAGGRCIMPDWSDTIYDKGHGEAGPDFLPFETENKSVRSRFAFSPEVICGDNAR